MSDLISRQAAIDALVDALYDLDEHDFVDNVFIEEELKRVPSIKPEIIRCKDCKDYQTDWKTRYANMHYCATMDSTMPEDGFCSYAERKNDE